MATRRRSLMLDADAPGPMAQRRESMPEPPLPGEPSGSRERTTPREMGGAEPPLPPLPPQPTRPPLTMASTGPSAMAGQKGPGIPEPKMTAGAVSAVSPQVSRVSETQGPTAGSSVPLDQVMSALAGGGGGGAPRLGGGGGQPSMFGRLGGLQGGGLGVPGQGGKPDPRMLLKLLMSLLNAG